MKINEIEIGKRVRALWMFLILESLWVLLGISEFIQVYPTFYQIGDFILNVIGIFAISLGYYKWLDWQGSGEAGNSSYNTIKFRDIKCHIKRKLGLLKNV